MAVKAPAWNERANHFVVLGSQSHDWSDGQSAQTL